MFSNKNQCVLKCFQLWTHWIIENLWSDRSEKVNTNNLEILKNTFKIHKNKIMIEFLNKNLFLFASSPFICELRSSEQLWWNISCLIKLHTDNHKILQSLTKMTFTKIFQNHSKVYKVSKVLLKNKQWISSKIWTSWY